MSIAGILSSSLFSSLAPQSAQSKSQQIHSEFQQLGQDLTSGNLTQAQQDFATLEQNLPPQLQTSSNAATPNSNVNSSPLAQVLGALSSDLQSGNLTGAQQAFSALQEDLQQPQGPGQVPHHHHHHFSGGRSFDSASSAQSNPIVQAFGELGTALQSGNLSSAQQAYSTLQQDLQQYLPNFASTAGSLAQSSGGTTNVTV